MDKVQALHSFWAGFGWPAIDEQSAYDEKTLEEMNIDFPYITYEVATDEFDAPVAIGADLWDKSTTWTAVSQKAEQIYDAIGRGGRLVGYDEGCVWITRGNPFAQRQDAETGYDVRRIHININAEYLSA